MKMIIVKALRKIIKLMETKSQSQIEDNGPGSCELFGKKFYYHHKPSFDITFEEIFQKGIYTFKTKNPKPVIIDCGANMGLSLLFFFLNYPNSKIYAFEPDKIVLECLERNVRNYQMHNVALYKKAVWIKSEMLDFYTDKGMGGSLSNNYLDQSASKVEAIRLRDFIENEQIDFLKMDIEGAEFWVIQDCESVLKQVKNIFIEYHSFEGEEQKLDELLMILKRNDFRYHLSQSFSRKRPFVDKELACKKMDLAINIYGYR